MRYSVLGDNTGSCRVSVPSSTLLCSEAGQQGYLGNPVQCVEQKDNRVLHPGGNSVLIHRVPVYLPGMPQGGATNSHHHGAYDLEAETHSIPYRIWSSDQCLRERFPLQYPS